MNVFVNMVNLYNSLPENNTSKIVLKGMLDHLEKIPGASIYDVAEMTNSSRATIWRTIKLMGYKSYPQFASLLGSILSQMHYYNSALRAGNYIDDDSLIQAGVSQLKASADYLERMCSGPVLEQTLAALHKANKISIYDLPMSTPVFLIQNLILDKKSVDYLIFYPDMLKDSTMLNANSVVLSCPLEYPDMMDMTAVYRNIKTQGATLILASTEDSRYKEYADIILYADMGLHPNFTGQKITYEVYLKVVSDIYRKRYILSKKSESDNGLNP